MTGASFRDLSRPSSG
uniref:Uncharacterized protein n=1 Tax=Arundo donax TaxID=35708 RepID=A0A0A9GXY9_ARUDO